jgi:protein involved in temperature-dependent protein secretion
LPALSEWLQLMLAEIAAKREGTERARAEEQERALEAATDRRGAVDIPLTSANEDSAAVAEQSAPAEEGAAARAARS